MPRLLGSFDSAAASLCEAAAALRMTITEGAQDDKLSLVISSGFDGS